MKNLSVLFKTLAIILFLSPLNSTAQSLSGSVNSLKSAKKLGYANIDIFKNDKLVASILSDDAGEFHVKLDTGLYRCEIKYAGHEPVIKEIRVTNDEKSDFDLEKDESSKYSYESTDEVEVRTSYAPAALALSEVSEVTVSSMKKRPLRYKVKDKRTAAKIEKEFKRLYGEGDADGTADHVAYYDSEESSEGHDFVAVEMMYEEEVIAGPGKLTAGEINDFSKWEMWTDIAASELAQNKTFWQMNLQGRYSVQVTDEQGLPLADLKVQLTDRAGYAIYNARTDNTGKAELWQSLMIANSSPSNKLKIVVEAGNEKHEIKNAKSIDKGINTLAIPMECNQSQKVDIAFVVDATGSMSDELNFLKAEMNDVIYQSKRISSSLNFSFANVFYRDRGDSYLTRVQDFTRVLTESAAFISNQRAGGGGDFEEAVEVALDSAINGLSWSEEARTRIVFLVLDAPPHNTPEIQEKMRVLTKQAAEKGIRIVPIVGSGANKNLEYLLRSMALGTNGTYSFLTDHSGIGGGHMEPSTDSYDVETLNELLVRVVKSYTYMPDCEKQIPDLNLNYPDSVVVVNPVDSSQIPPVDTTQTPPADSTVSIPPPPIEISWKYYPNPTRGIVNIEANVDIKELYVTDLSGKVLQVLNDIGSEAKVQVDLSSYASGIYLIRYPVGQQWVSGKVILVR